VQVHLRQQQIVVGSVVVLVVVDKDRSALADPMDRTLDSWQVVQDTEVVVVIAGSTDSCSDHFDTGVERTFPVVEKPVGYSLGIVPFLDGSR